MSVAQRSASRTVRRVLYYLRRRWGSVSIQIQNVTADEGSFNPETGKETTIKEILYLRNVITFSTKQTTRFEYDLGFVAANKNFTYGNLFNVGDRIFIVDGLHVPRAFKVDLEKTYIVFEGEKFDVADYEKMDHNAGYIFSTRKTEGKRPEAVYTTVLEQILDIEQEITAEL